MKMTKCQGGMRGKTGLLQVILISWTLYGQSSHVELNRIKLAISDLKNTIKQLQESITDFNHNTITQKADKITMIAYEALTSVLSLTWDTTVFAPLIRVIYTGVFLGAFNPALTPEPVNKIASILHNEVLEFERRVNSFQQSGNIQLVPDSIRYVAIATAHVSLFYYTIPDLLNRAFVFVKGEACVACINGVIERGLVMINETKQIVVRIKLSSIFDVFNKGLADMEYVLNSMREYMKRGELNVVHYQIKHLQSELDHFIEDLKKAISNEGLPEKLTAF